MSINFYFRNKAKHKELEEYNESMNVKINEIVEKVTALRDYDSLAEQIKSQLEQELLLDSEEYDIHIGQKAFSWSAILKANTNLYSTVAEMKQWYVDNSNEYIIVNEYDEELTWEELEKDLLESKGKDRGNFKDTDGYCWMYGDFS